MPPRATSGAMGCGRGLGPALHPLYSGSLLPDAAREALRGLGAGSYWTE